MARRCDCLGFLCTLLAFAAPAGGTTISGRVVIPESAMGWSPGLGGLTVRVEGTGLVVPVDAATGEFRFADVPVGSVPLVLVEAGTDVFTQASKRTRIDVGPGGATGAGFALVYHWAELRGYPPHWGESDRGEWTPWFTSADVGFILFRIRATDAGDPERMELHRTTDGGLAWQEIGRWVLDPDLYRQGRLRFPSLWREFYFADADHGVVAATSFCLPCGSCIDGVFQTADGGARWTFRPLPVPEGSYALSLIRFDRIDALRWLVAGGSGCGVQGYSGKFYDAIWETDDAGESWELAAAWEPALGATGLGAYADGRAIAFFTPYGGAGGRLARREGSGVWAAEMQTDIVTNSGYGPADVPVTDGVAWVSNFGDLPRGLYSSDDGGASWTWIADPLVQYMDFATAQKGFGLFGGAPGATYDGGRTWLLQGAGGGICCHVQSIWSFDATHAIWHEGGFGDPNQRAQLFSYQEPWEADFEVRPAMSLAAVPFVGGDRRIPAASFELVAHGPVPIRIDGLTLRAAGSGDDAVSILKLDCWEDREGDALPGTSDVLLGSALVASNDGAAAMPLTSTLLLEHLVPVRLLVTADFAPDLCPRSTFRVSLAASDVAARDAGTGGAVAATAPPGTALAGRTLTAGERVFDDDFEGGLARWAVVSGDPVPDPGYGWQLGAGGPMSPGQAATIRDDREHEGWGVEHSLELRNPLDLSPPGDYFLSFTHRYALEPTLRLWVEASSDGGASWSELASYGDPGRGSSTGGRFVEEVIDLAHHAGSAALRLRFRFDWTSGWYFSGSWQVDDARLHRLAATQPKLEVEPRQHDFGTSVAGTPSTPFPVVVGNAGGADLALGELAVEGPGAASFELRNDECSGATVAPCAEASVDVVFTPAALGEASATLDIPSNDPAAPLVRVALRGSGALRIHPVEGTAGTRLTIDGAGFGASKGRVAVGKSACRVLVWSERRIECVLQKWLDPGTYDVAIRPRGEEEIVAPLVFAVRAPVVTSLLVGQGPAGSTARLQGLFLGAKKQGAKVQLVGPAGGRLKRWTCKITAWAMDAVTGDTTVDFVVPRQALPGTYDVVASVRGFAATIAAGFVIE